MAMAIYLLLSCASIATLTGRIESSWSPKMKFHPKISNSFLDQLSHDDYLTYDVSSMLRDVAQFQESDESKKSNKEALITESTTAAEILTESEWMGTQDENERNKTPQENSKLLTMDRTQQETSNGVSSISTTDTEISEDVITIAGSTYSNIADKGVSFSVLNSAVPSSENSEASTPGNTYTSTEVSSERDGKLELSSVPTTEEDTHFSSVESTSIIATEFSAVTEETPSTSYPSSSITEIFPESSTSTELKPSTEETAFTAELSTDNPTLQPENQFTITSEKEGSSVAIKEDTASTDDIEKSTLSLEESTEVNTGSPTSLKDSTEITTASPTNLKESTEVDTASTTSLKDSTEISTTSPTNLKESTEISTASPTSEETVSSTYKISTPKKELTSMELTSLPSIQSTTEDIDDFSTHNTTDDVSRKLINISNPTIRTLKIALSVTLLALIIIIVSVLIAYMIKLKRNIIPYEELNLQP